MLDGAQEAVGLGEFVAGLIGDPAFVVERFQHVEGAPPAQARAAPAEDELLRLHEELDLADAAASELDVVACHRDLVVPAHRVDLPLHGMHVGNGGEVEILAPDEGAQLVQKVLAERKIAGDGPCLDERRALPVLADGLVIDVGGGKRHGGRRRAGIGAQAIIDAMHIAVGGALLQELGELLGDAGIDRRRLGRIAQRRRFRIEEDHEIDVARVVELPCPMLAERQHGEARALAGIDPDPAGLTRPRSAISVRTRLTPPATDASAKSERACVTCSVLQRPPISASCHEQRMSVAVLPERRAPPRRA